MKQGCGALIDGERVENGSLPALHDGDSRENLPRKHDKSVSCRVTSRVQPIKLSPFNKRRDAMRPSDVMMQVTQARTRTNKG